MSTKAAFGSIVAHHFGLEDAPTLVARPARDARLGVSRLSVGTGDVGPRRSLPPEDSFVVTLHLADYNHHELWQRRERPMRAPYYPKDSISIVNLLDGPSATVGSPLEALSFYIPRPTLDAFSDAAPGPRVADLACEPAVVDPILASLGAALLPLFDKPVDACALFVDQIGLALQTHLAVTYGGVRLPIRSTGGLAQWQETRAKEFLVAAAPGEVSIAGAAAACDLSPSHFIRAFKQTTGRTPHRWLLEHRVDKAKELLRLPLPIADIALECGFADQSHFTRVFRNIVGLPPGAWRRKCRG